MCVMGIYLGMLVEDICVRLYVRGISVRMLVRGICMQYMRGVFVCEC